METNSSWGKVGKYIYNITIKEVDKVLFKTDIKGIDRTDGRIAINLGYVIREFSSSNFHPLSEFYPKNKLFFNISYSSLLDSPNRYLYAVEQSFIYQFNLQNLSTKIIESA